VISRIIFTGDSFRTTAGETNQFGNALWMDEILGQILRETTGKPSTVALPLVGASMADFIALQDGSPTLDGWASVFWQKPTDRLVNAIADGCKNALVVGFEMPPVMVTAMDAADVPWVSVSISPLRFLPDWALHVRASRHFDPNSITDVVVTTDDIAAAVAHVSRWYRPSNIKEPTHVFFAQTLHDRSVIRGHRFCGIEDLADVVTPDFVKPHPWEPDSPILRHLLARGARIMSEETYALLANPHVEVVTFSSSVGREAQAFGRPVTILSPSVQDWTFSGVDLMRHWIDQRYWAPLFQSAGIQTHKVMGPSWSPNLLRSKHGGQGLSMDVWA
jgi:hypothetical protein